MHASAILLFASVALPILAAPVSTSNISPIPDVERRHDSYKSTWVIDFSKRAPEIGSASPRASYDIIERIKRQIGFPGGGPGTNSAVVVNDALSKRDRGVKWGNKRDPEPKVSFVERGPGGVKWGGKRASEETTEELIARGPGGVKWGGKRDSEKTKELFERDPRGVHWGGKREAEESKELEDRARGVKWGPKRDAEPKELEDRARGVKWGPKRDAESKELEDRARGVKWGPK
ncbi:unnamed protein product [Alternaria alternata]